MWKPKENLNFGVDIYALSIYNSCINESHVCVLRHNFMDVHNIGILALKKCMN